MPKNYSLPYRTDLSEQEQLLFDLWQKKNQIPYDSSPKSDYDMTGYFKAMLNKDPNAKSSINEIDNKRHFPDKYKTPYHKSFSNESMYADESAPHWDNTKLVNPQGDTVGLELPNEFLRLKQKGYLK